MKWRGGTKGGVVEVKILQKLNFGLDKKRNKLTL
jgi:hypothetical protein